MEELLSQGREKIVDGIAYSDDQPLAILVPSVIFGTDRSGANYVSGPACVIKIEALTHESLWSALVQSGSLIFGQAEEIRQVKERLQAGRTSRTSSYLLGRIKNCHDFLSAAERLEALKVLIVGCGGIGSMTALNLAGAGVRHITLIDGDRIEKSNLNRQFFWEDADVGKLKADQLKQVIGNRFADVDCIIANEFLSEDEITERSRDHDVTIITADEPLGLGQSAMNGALHTADRLVISSGYFHQYLSIEAGNASTSYNSATEDIQWRRSPGFIGPSFGPSNTELAGLIASFTVNYVVDKGHGLNWQEGFKDVWDSRVFPRKSLRE
ncbi:ThiF family adenylyltransferase [Pseudomonas chlororaphis]|uniref:THIF-type NAD/FAD binding fold domain-containing protein n=1 Tax=Pseudomonas chlororaphis TaxID=587753 RepID=A0A1Q8EXH9_9PSED|nr:ThiF family adenylyltransferase [Pseudomonas chlororaphis]OLF56506.1 hypothetical protein BTN82_00970 [Pseudomonas chlororaphis]